MSHLINQRYVLQDLIGRGGMGAVYRALDRLTGQIVALKRVLHPVSFAPADSGSTFSPHYALAREFQLLASLRHPHIITVWDYGFDEEHQPFFTMDWLDSHTHILAASVGQSLKAQVRLIFQMLQALQYLHRRQIVHHDLKPGNVLVQRGQVKLLDFGLSSMHGEASHSQDSAVGTWAYMSPEVLQGQRATFASDLFALGVIVCEMLGGKRPFATVADTLLNPPNLATLPDQFLLRHFVATLLHKDPHLRYESARKAMLALSQATNQPLPPETAAIRESHLQAANFVGRTAELAQLTQHINRTLQGEGSAWLIGGESGAGKSRLLNELSPLALVRGLLLLRGQAVREAHIAYHLWGPALRRLSLVTPLTDLEASILKLFVPNIADLQGRPIPDPPAHLTPQDARSLLVTAVTTLFTRQNQPILLLLEDLHWADSDSLDLLRQIAPLCARFPLLIIATYRDDEAPTLPSDLPVLRLLKLARLPQEHIAELSAAMLGVNGRQPHIIAFLQRETEGNAFFLVETVRALAEEAGRLEQIGQMVLPEHLLPGGVQQVIQRRLSQVSPPTYQLLQTAALIGRQINVPLLQTLASLPLVAWLGECENAAILQIQEGQWHFAHDKLREVLWQSVSVNGRRHLHQTIAEAMEALAPSEYVAALAYHWREAGHTGKEAHYATLAGEQALALNAFHEALPYLQRALDLVPESASVASLKMDLGRVYQGLNQLDKAQTMLLQSVTLYQQTQNLAGQAHALAVLCGVTYTLGAYAEARTIGQQGVKLAQEVGDRLALARNLGNLGAIAYAQGNYHEARQQYQQSYQITEALEDLWESSQILNKMGNVAFDLGEYDEAEGLYQQSLALSRQIGYRRGMARCLNNLALIAERHEAYPQARDLHQQSLAIKRDLEDRAGIAISLTNLGVIAFALANYEEARDLLLEALELCREVGDTWGVACCLSNLSDVHVSLQELGRARGFVREALEMSLSIQALPLMYSVFISAAFLLAAEGAWATAVALLSFVQVQEELDSHCLLRSDKLLRQYLALLSPEAGEAACQDGQRWTLFQVQAQLLAS